MPIHDWTHVADGIFNAFHHTWVGSIAGALNAGVLQADHYAMPEQLAVEPDPNDGTLQGKITNQTEVESYRRKKSTIVVRHVSGDQIIAMIEIMSPGNMASKHAVRSFLTKACELLERRIHLLIIDPFPPGPRDPEGVHGLIWGEVTDEEYRLPPGKPLTLVAYEADLVTRAYVYPVAVGDTLPDVPLFLEPNGCVMVPLEATYTTAFDVQPRRWRNVLQPPG